MEDRQGYEEDKKKKAQEMLNKTLKDNNEDNVKGLIQTLLLN